MARSGSRIGVLLIAPSLAMTGGQAVQADKLMAALRLLPDLDVQFFPIDPQPPFWLRWLRKIPVVRTVLMFVLYMSGLLRRVPRSDVLHVFTAGLSSYTLWTIPALLVARMFRRKFLMHYHDGQAEQHLTEWRTAAPTIALADKLVVPSGFLVDAFRKHGLEAHVVSNIVDLDRFPFRQRDQLEPRLMTNRMLEPHYNVACIVRAFALIQAEYPNATLTVAHDGPCRPSLELLARELRLQNVTFIGRVQYHDIPRLYDDADIYVMTPNIDNMPGSVLECFASGIPVISTNAGGIPYIAEDRRTALLVGVDDHKAVAACALELLRTPELSRRLTQNAAVEVQRYHWELIQAEWLTLYRSLINRG